MPLQRLGGTRPRRSWLGGFSCFPLRGWCPPIQVFRHLGVWTGKSMSNGALKTIRGEVDDLPSKVRGSVADAGVERVFLTVSR